MEVLTKGMPKLRQIRCILKQIWMPCEAHTKHGKERIDLTDT